ncbi:AAEL002561-PA [Aedes aegypti]|uniref:AAEL002561-PA n=1 Tax=Aedes aegypti TaxID=7159 RepID=Q17HU3_AEDAE|nr:AAEL002561-PA [Aedes aegypti]
MRPIVASLVIVLAALNIIQPTEAFGFDFLDELAELLFGSSEEEWSSGVMVIKKDTGTVDVVCDKCNLTVNCINCTRIDTNIMDAAPTTMSTASPGSG